MVPACDSEQTANLLKILGYRMRGSCGTDVVLETVNATKAFITVDSGFPLAELERDLRANRRFELPYAPTTVPVLYNAAYWLGALGRGERQFPGRISLRSFAVPSVSRPIKARPAHSGGHATAGEAAKLKVYAHVLDFLREHVRGSQWRRRGAWFAPGLGGTDRRIAEERWGFLREDPLRPTTAG